MTKLLALEGLGEDLAVGVERMRSGEDVLITRDGLPVAALVPVSGAPGYAFVNGKRVLTPEQREAMDRIIARMEEGWPLNAGPLDRDSLYDR